MATKNTLKGPSQTVALGGETRTVTGTGVAQPTPTSRPVITQNGVQTLTPSNVGQPPTNVMFGDRRYVGGPYDQYQEQLFADLEAKGIPRSYINGQLSGLNSGKLSNGNRNLLPYPDVADEISYAWSKAGEKERSEYAQADNAAIDSVNAAADSQNATTLTNNTVKNQVTGNTDYWNKNVDPALSAVPKALNAQQTGNRASEAELTGLTNQYTDTVNRNQGLRMQDIETTNAAGRSLVNQLGQQTTATNQANSGLASQLNSAAASTNAANTGLANQLQGAASSTNANQTAALGQLLNQNSQSNAQQNQHFGTLSNANAASNSRQNQILNTYVGQNEDSNVAQIDAMNDLLLKNQLANQQQNLNASNLNYSNRFHNSQQNATLQAFQSEFANLNAADQRNYMTYLQETNPQMAQLVAQGSDPSLVQNQQEALGRWKDISTPQVTAQEQLLAELARRKFETGDRSSREAVMSQLAGRGLQSGGLVIAGQQAEQQQLGQDRVLAQLGLQASAVNRGMTGLQGYTDTASMLRNADDSVRQFQDQYRQSEALRTSNLAQNRANTGLNTTNQQGIRSQAVYDAGTQTTDRNAARDLVNYNANTETVENNSNRDLTGYNAQHQSIGANANRNLLSYNAGTETVNNNSDRDQSTYDAGTETVNNNADRNLTSFDANTKTNYDNFGRTDTAVTNSQLTNQNNFGNTERAVTNNQFVNQNNLGNNQTYTTTGLGELGAASTRYSNGLAAGDTTANNVLAAGQIPINARTTNLQNEVGSATTGANTAIAGQGAHQGITETEGAIRRKAIDDFLAGQAGGRALTAAEKAAKEN